MAKGYVIFHETIHDQAGYDGYVQKVLPTITEAGGRLFVVEDDAEVLEGKAPGSRVVVLEFDSVDAARAWYSSPGYQAIIGERHASAEADAYIVAGLNT